MFLPLRLSESSGLAKNLRQISLSETAITYFSQIKSEIVFPCGRSQALFSVGYRKFVTVLFFRGSFIRQAIARVNG
jgi:hypothetical protein